MSELNTNTVKFKVLNNDELMNLNENEINLMNKRFRLFDKESILKPSKWIFLYKNKFSAENVIGFMELNRYIVTDNATMSDKEAIHFDIFNDKDFIFYSKKTPSSAKQGGDELLLLRTTNELKYIDLILSL